MRGDLPARQLAMALDRMIDRADRGSRLFNGAGFCSTYSHGTDIRRRLGVSERMHYAWRVGQHLGITLAKADEVMTRAGWLWWDVWNEDTVRRPVLVVGRYHPNARAADSRRRRRERLSATLYGDLGPDLEALERVRRVWEPELEEVAA